MAWQPLTVPRPEYDQEERHGQFSLAWQVVDWAAAWGGRSAKKRATPRAVLFTLIDIAVILFIKNFGGSSGTSQNKRKVHHHLRLPSEARPRRFVRKT